MSLITMSQYELNQLEAIQKIRGRRLSAVDAARLLSLSRKPGRRTDFTNDPEVIAKRKKALERMDAAE